MKIQFTIAAAAILLSANLLTAQQISPERPQEKSSQTESKEPNKNQAAKDQAFAKCLTITNKEAVMLAQYAKENCSTDEVKAFAATLEDAHQNCLTKLKELASKRVESGKATSEVSSFSANNVPVIDFLQMHQEMSDQCLKDTKQMLSEKEGIAFDECFVGMEIAKHAMMHSSLTVLHRHTTGDLQTFIAESLETNQEHMKAATSLMKTLSEKIVAKTATNTK